MNNIKQGVMVCVVALTQLMLNPSAIASDEDYSNINEVQFSEAELAQILAPVALYPDSLLTHIVIASTYPLEVVEAFRWLVKNSKLDASDAVDEAEKNGWDPSVTALVAFPSVLERLSEDLQWTQSLGDAFLEDEGRLLDTIQILREQAMRANSLDNMQNMRVTKVNRQIVIEPVQKEIVYVPYYDTRVVYGDWHWNRHPPVYWDYRPHFAVHFPGRVSGRFHWNVGINIGFNYFFSAFEWRSRHLVVTHHHKTRQYRSYRRIALSQGAQRWRHKPSHRRGVAYRSNELKLRYSSRKHSKLYAKQLRASESPNSNTRGKSKNYKRNFGDNNQGIGKERRTLGKYNKERAFTRKLKSKTERADSKATNKRYVNSFDNNTNKRAQQKRKTEDMQNRRSNRRSFKEKLSRNNNDLINKYNVNEGARIKKQFKQGPRQQRQEGFERNRASIDYAQSNNVRQRPSSHRQVINREQTKGHSKKSLRQAVRASKPSEQVRKKKKER